MQKRDINALLRASEELHSQSPDCKRAINFDFCLYIISMLAVIFSILHFIGMSVIVSGPSMNPTLLNRERLIVERVSYYFREPERGEIIICHYPQIKDNIVKRIVGLPGETVSVEGGEVYIDGKKLDESAYWNDSILGDMPPRTVEEGHVFVMGDNRNNSTDSRQPFVGAIPYHKIEGRAMCIMWPISRMQVLQH